MDARIKTSFGFLVACSLLWLILPTGQAQQPQPKGELYVIPRAGRCTETALPLELDNVKPLPAEVLLRIKRFDDEKEVGKWLLTLNNDTYKWSGLLTPLGKYRAELYDARDRTTLLGQFTFNNIDILKDFVKEERGEITYISRGGEGAENNNTESDSERKSLLIDHLPASDGSNRLHIIVMNSRGLKAAEYFDRPPKDGRWESPPLLLGQYRLIVVEYKGDGNCQTIRGR